MPVAGEREYDFVPSAAEVLRVVTPPEEHGDIGPFVLQSVDKVHEVGFDTATVAVLPVICDKCNLHPDLILTPAHIPPRSPSRYFPTYTAPRTRGSPLGPTPDPVPPGSSPLGLRGQQIRLADHTYLTR